jgi:predicted house-cleaning noncanonical NTP pyrophosphatase (MazG superfamily)
VVPLAEKHHRRQRKNIQFGKFIRDKVSIKIAQQQKIERSRRVPAALAKGFLISKVIEEALEIRNAPNKYQKSLELADLYEVLRALADAEGIPLEEIARKADEKKEVAGGFENGTILMQTAIPGRTDGKLSDEEAFLMHILARKVSNNCYEILFSFFGFMVSDQPKALTFDELGMN